MALLLSFGFIGSASAILVDRGGALIYDDVLDITWTRQAGDGVARDWANSVAWASNLVFAGFDDWRLPYASVAAGAGPALAVYNCTGTGVADELACRDNEMGYMFYYNLDGDFGDNKTGTQTAVGAEVLKDIQLVYWSGTEVNSFLAWDFSFGNGSPSFGVEFANLSAWAVRPGDVVSAAVPESGTLVLLGLGLD